MNLAKILNNIQVVQVCGKAELKEINSLSINSRKVEKDTIFFALKGYKTDGHKFILDVINNNAAAVVLQDNEAIPEQMFIHSGCVKILVEDSRKALAEISAVFYDNPTTKINLVGITGTKGKTTTSNFVKSVLGGDKCGLIGTINISVGSKEVESKLTTPEAHDLNAIFSEMVNEGCTSGVMEVSSHSLELHRVDHLDFDVAVFTNLAHDHLDFHKTEESYFEAKKKLFTGLKPEAKAIINIDDINAKAIVKNTKATVYSYGLNDKADFKISDVNYSLEGTEFDINYTGKKYHLSTALIGEFNAYNCCAAFAVGIVSGIDSSTIIKRIKETKQVPGRFEIVSSKGKCGIIDYSHTPESLEQALLAIKNINKDNLPVYTVFGCGGDRDKTKRPMMGKIATRLSDMVLVTTDNPRTENPIKIIDEIVKGIETNNYKIIPDREQAIKEAIESSPQESIILVAGKGHEEYIEINGKRHHFSDKEKVKEYLK